MAPGQRTSSHDAAALGSGETGGEPLAATGPELADIQRARIVAAMVSVAARQGVGRTTVARVVACSGVSRRTFYELFEDREQCFLAAFDDGARRAERLVTDAYASPAPWPARVRAALVALLAFLEREPDFARLLVVEALGAGPRALEHRREPLERAAAIVDRDGRAAARGGHPPPLVAEGVLGGALSVIHARMAGEGRPELVELLNPLVSMIVLPYLGPAAARAELERPVAPASTNGDRGHAGADPLRGLNMRLTYRTVRVLLAVAELPGASNREIADGASIRDQGQISKLLTRLEHVGLIANGAVGRVKGQPNSWTLTPAGSNVSRALALRDG